MQGERNHNHNLGGAKKYTPRKNNNNFKTDMKMEIVKVKSENGIKNIKIEMTIEKEETEINWGEREKEIRKKIEEDDKKIREIILEYLKTEEDKDLAYIKKKEGAYERYIRANWEEVLQPTNKKDEWEENKTVVFIENGNNVRLVKRARVYHKNGEKIGKISNVKFEIHEPEMVEDVIKMNGQEGTKKELYLAVMKYNALVCDIDKM